jgi:hypothetical protein
MNSESHLQNLNIIFFCCIAESSFEHRGDWEGEDPEGTQVLLSALWRIRWYHIFTLLK